MNTFWSEVIEECPCCNKEVPFDWAGDTCPKCGGDLITGVPANRKEANEQLRTKRLD